MTRRDSGAALLLALVVSGLLAALGMSVLLVADTERRAAANAFYATEALAAADAGLERAIADLRIAPSWTAILNGAEQSAFADATRRPRLPAGGTLDLDAATSELQSESDAGGTLGANTPIWRLFAWGPLSAMVPSGAPQSLEYVAVWVADDPSERDGNPVADSNGTISVHAESRGPAGARRRLEATVTRGAAGTIRMISWREVR